MENLDELKAALPGSARLTYKLEHATVYVSPGGHHFIDALDPEGDFRSEIDASCLTDEESSYIETRLEANSEKFTKQVDIVREFVPLDGATVLDIGCGGGLFLSLLERSGARVVGIELSDSRAEHARQKHNLRISKFPIESDFWQTQYDAHFDVVVLFDVIEHVNYPVRTVRGAHNVLKRGGLLLIDTPCRDALFHRVGAITYWLSGGRYPTFLNAMYSSRLFGHKQIFSATEIKSLLRLGGLEVIELRRFHELSFPYDFYIKKLIHSERVAARLLPVVTLFFRLFRIRNKMLVVGRKE